MMMMMIMMLCIGTSLEINGIISELIIIWLKENVKICNAKFHSSNCTRFWVIKTPWNERATNRTYFLSLFTDLNRINELN